MMFGIPGAALAMVHTAKSNKKKVAIGLVTSAAIASVCLRCYRAVRVCVHVPRSGAVRDLRSAVRDLYSDYSTCRIPRGIQLLGRTDCPGVLGSPSGSSEYMDDHSAWHCGIYRILPCIPFRDCEI